MNVYIEYVVFDNIVVNLLILLCVKWTVKLKTNWWRLFLSAMLGTTVAVLLPLWKISSILQIAIKLALGNLMILIVSKFYRIKDYLFAFLLFIAYTFLLGGASIATLLLFGSSFEVLMQGGYDTSVPLGILLLIISFYVYFIYLVARYLSRRKNISPFMRKIKLYILNKQLDLMGFVDTGNCLIDEKTKLPVVIISIKALEKYFTKDQLEKLALKDKDCEFKNVHLTNYNTISGNAKKMIVFEADKLSIFLEGKEYITNKFVVGLTYQNFKDAINYDLLLNVNMI